MINGICFIYLAVRDIFKLANAFDGDGILDALPYIVLILKLTRMLYFVCLWFNVTLENFSLIWRRPVLGTH